jgi:hypothetical protein
MIPSQFLAMMADPDADKLVITTAVPVDDQFSSPRQIRWSATMGKLLVANLVYRHERNANLAFYSKNSYNSQNTAIDGDLTKVYSCNTAYLYKNYYNNAGYEAALAIASPRMIDASGDPLHVYVTSNNATDGHGVRMITKSTMTVTNNGAPVQILATGIGDSQFTNPLGLLYIATDANSGFLYVCEATRICKIAVVTTAGSESFTWTTSYAIVANDLAWDGTNFYVQSSTQTIKYDNVFTDATKVATACVGYSITYIPDQGDGYGATLAIVDSTNSHLERRKCSDLSAINSVGSAGDGSSSLFDPTFTTSVATQIEYKFDDGFSYVTPLGTSHALYWNGFAGYSFRSAGPHKCTITVRGGLGLVTGIDCNADAVINIKNAKRLSNVSSYSIQSNPSMIICETDMSLIYTYLNIAINTFTSIGIVSLSRILISLYAAGSGIYGSLANLPPTIQNAQMHVSTTVSAASISYLVAIRDLRVYSMDWLTAEVDLVLLSISDAIHANVNHFTYATPALNIGGTNQAPSHLDGWIDPLITPGTGNSDDHWEWDAAAGKHKAISGGAAIWAANHAAGHPWTITFASGISEDRIVGDIATTWASVSAKDVLVSGKFLAVAGTVGDIRIPCLTSGNVKVALYTDNAGEPGTLLAYNNGVAVVTGVNVIQLNVQVSLTATNYWLVFKTDTANLLQYNAIGGVGRHKADAYANGFPNPAGAGYTNGTYILAIAGWGLKVV